MNLTFPLLAALEGLTEYLPISSTAHLILAGKLLSVDLADPYIKFYLLFIQLGALCAALIIFSKRILTDRNLFLNIAVSFIPTALVAFTLYKVFKHLLEGNLPLMAAMLALGGLVFIWLEKYFLPARETAGVQAREHMTVRDAFVIGLAQTLAIIPGVSRSGITIIAGILIGIQKRVIVEYTFLLALPTLGAAVLYDAYKSREMLTQIQSYSDLFIGFAVAAIVGYFTLQALRKYLPTIPLSYFGWYRIALAALIYITLV